jgi:hypothetical protein
MEIAVFALILAAMSAITIIKKPVQAAAQDLSLLNRNVFLAKILFTLNIQSTHVHLVKAFA